MHALTVIAAAWTALAVPAALVLGAAIRNADQHAQTAQPARTDHQLAA